MELIPSNFREEIDIRLNKLRRIMESSGVDALLVAFNCNIYYTTGRFFRGFCYIPLNQAAIWFVIKPSFYKETSEIEYIRKPEQIAEILQKRGISLPQTLGLEYDDLTFSEIIRFKNIFPGSEFANGSIILKRSRMVKTDWEISQMREDGIHQSNVYSKLSHCYKPGMTDLQLQIELERELRLEGALGVSRVSGNLMEINMGSVISGDNADNPGPYDFTMGGSGMDPSLPVGADNHKIIEGQTVMIDMNGAFNGYQTDMTRVWALGEISDLARKAHECSVRILHTLEKYSVPGISVASVYEKAMEIVREEKLEDYFMGHSSKVNFIGHGVGIQLNELPVVTPRSKDILEENMTIALEPKFVIPHVGAVGIENTYRVTETGLENLTIFPEEIGNLK